MSSRKRPSKEPERMGIGAAMAGVGLVAFGLAFLRGRNPGYVGAFGPLLAVMLWIFFEGVIRRRRMEGFHYATAIVTVPVSGMIARWIALGRFRPLGPLAGLASPWFVGLGEFLIGGAISLLLGVSAGWVVRRLEQARGWDLAPMFRGAVVGSFLAVPIMLALWGPTWNDTSTVERSWQIGALAAGFVAGGFTGAARG
ncbi:hypothetical protein [Paludisphaera rhizosphaerae]|uniref:hypothetical protein n=1 Tax=Paludisphaera rhizosphaerae TaxID=2711216 RepID=UPI0013EC6852|nr:hypothetical protein [Paludisphaera rhizosphaerae]